ASTTDEDDIDEDQCSWAAAGIRSGGSGPGAGRAEARRAEEGEHEAVAGRRQGADPTARRQRLSGAAQRRVGPAGARQGGSRGAEAGGREQLGRRGALESTKAGAPDRAGRERRLAQARGPGARGPGAHGGATDRPADGAAVPLGPAPAPGPRP